MKEVQQLPTLVRLEAKNLRVAYDRFVAIDFEELKIEGQIIALLGHNGAGKSTLIKSVLGLLPPQAGQLSVEFRSGGQPLSLIPEEHMAFCPETGSVFSDITVESYVKLWCRLKHRDPKYYKKQGRKFMELLSIDPLLKRYGRELSKGQRRRVQTVIGFLTNPKLFLFDEPFDGLDVQKTNELAEIIRAVSSEMSFIISSHRMDVMERLADAFIVLREGRVLSYGTLSKVCKDLCNTTYAVSNCSKLESTLQEFRNFSPHSLITRVGTQLFVTGRELNEVNVREKLAALGETSVTVEEIEPSLVDAMNYHLKLTDAAPRVENVFRHGGTGEVGAQV